MYVFFSYPNFVGVSEQGSRVCAYAPTAVDGPPNLYQIQSISAMLVNCNKSHEELRHEDYERGDRGKYLKQSLNFKLVLKLLIY